MHAEVVNGMSVLAVRDAVTRAAKLCREGQGPVLLECMTYRYMGHSSMPLHFLYSTNNPVIVYLHERDLKEIKDKKYENGYLWSHLAQDGTAINKGFDGGNIIQTSMLSPTSSNSDVVLVMPEGGDKSSYYYAYDILSLGRYNYTTAPLSDINSISKAKIVVTPSEEIGLKMMHYKREYNLQYEKLIVLNLDGYGKLMNISNTTTLSPLTIEDNASTEWIAEGIGSGRIGIPKLTDDPDTKISGNNSLAINVGGGKYAHWQVSKLLYNKPINLTKFDFVKFHWYGRGDGKWYYLMFTTGQNQVFYYRFQDSWSGWKQIILPLQMPDGRGHIFDVTFDKITSKGASWAKINRIDVGPKENTLNQAGEFYLDGLSFGNMLKSSNIKSISNKNEIQFSTNLDIYPIIFPSQIII